jgi:hypothetical protein
MSSSTKGIHHSSRKSCLQQFKQIFPPYAKYAIFFACGLEVLYHAFLMAINQKFFEMASKIFPVAFKMFNDTVRRGSHHLDFQWTDAEMAQLNLYQTKLILMWFISTCTILFSMVCVVPQFCEFEEASGRHRTWCMKKPKLGYIMAPIFIILAIIGFSLLTWQWMTCQADSDLFHQLFKKSLKEESYLSVLERELDCTTDDDKEVELTDWLNKLNPTVSASTTPVRSCKKLIESSMLNLQWLNPLYLLYIIFHLVIVLFFGFFNQEHFKMPWNVTNDTDSEGDLESGARLI